MDPIEELWDNLLSREHGLVLRAFQSLGPVEQAAVKQHLHRMVAEPGWHPQQQISAQTALAAIRDLPANES